MINDMILLTIYLRNHERFLRWTISEPGFIPQEETELLIPNITTSYDPRSNGTGKIHVAEDGSMIVLVGDDRELYEIGLERFNLKDGTLTTSRGSTVQHQPYCQRDYLVSNDGLTVVGIYVKCSAWSDTTKCDHEEMQPVSPGFRKTRIELTFVDTSRVADKTRTIELERVGVYRPQLFNVSRVALARHHVESRSLIVTSRPTQLREPFNQT